MVDTELTPGCIEVLGHSLGVNVYHAKRSTRKKDKKLPKEYYRNRFCAGDNHLDFPFIVSLWSRGYMARGREINEGEWLWYVTDEGIKRFEECFNEYVQ